MISDGSGKWEVGSGKWGSGEVGMNYEVGEWGSGEVGKWEVGEKQSITGFLKFDWESIILSRWVLKIVRYPPY
ncbi:MAG: hypothetical protein O9324_24585 [Microcystis sp. LE19-84.1B]|uniref:hypothetical protein n=1 Tax=Microcystis sp. LE19-84.1B TaxID=3016438 RepID=UPI001E0E5D4F|nr:hypothetical protein [Microcystis sp. LE19-84.1B]MCZ8227028.1 hypothetical protein [Microcystis sp. LE19-84.1B]NCS27316.1 hypothetical protein [Microcystis aeruginosa F13-15]